MNKIDKIKNRLCRRLMSIKVNINLIRSMAMENSIGLQVVITKVTIKMMKEKVLEKCTGLIVASI
jgi:hypothetical protein